MTIRVVFPLCALLLTGTAGATFELKDPAEEMRQDEQLIAEAAAGQRSCFDFLVDSVERPNVYQASLAWAREAVATASVVPVPGPVEGAIRTYCIDHPKQGVAEAVQAMVASPAAD